MSWKLANAVAEKQIGEAKLLAIVVALHCFQDSLTCHPSIPRLAKLCEISERAAYRQLKKLKRLGYASVKRRQHLPALITLHLDAMPNLRPDAGDNPDLTLVTLRPDTGGNRNKEEKVLKRLKARGNAFVPPTLAQVTQYCQERRNNVDPEHFMDFYITRGWKLRGGLPMRDWEAAVRTWERNGMNNGGKGGYVNPAEKRQADTIKAANEARDRIVARG